MADFKNNLSVNGHAVVKSTDAAGGDLSGTFPNPTVAKVNGQAWAASPGDTNSPVWSASASQWQFSTINKTSKGSAGGQPSAPAVGDVFLPSNGFDIERYNGTGWDPWVVLFPATAPPTTGWSWDNQGSASVSTTNGGIFFTTPANASGNAHVYYRSAPSTPWTLTVCFLPMPIIQATSNHGFGICFRESSSGKLHALYYQDWNNAAPVQLYSNKWTTSSSFSANYVQIAPFFHAQSPMWMQISDDGTNRITRIGNDGINWIQISSVGRTDFLTANQIGLFLREYSTYAVGMQLLSWATS